MRKTSADLKTKQLSIPDAKAADKSWAVVGGDTSMSSIAFTAIGFDGTLNKMTKVEWHSTRWTNDEDDYIQRLADAANAHYMVLNLLKRMWVIDPDKVFIFIEEPIPLGLVNSGRVKFQSAWMKQQCEVSGAVLGSLARYGFMNIWQINNQQWKAALRKEGVTIRKMPEGKFDVKDWAIQAYGLPDFPDLVKSKSGSKIPRPTEGYGAKAKAVQPDDVYDAAACMAFGQNFVNVNLL